MRMHLVLAVGTPPAGQAAGMESAGPVAGPQKRLAWRGLAGLQAPMLIHTALHCFVQLSSPILPCTAVFCAAT